MYNYQGQLTYKNDKDMENFHTSMSFDINSNM